MERTVNRYFPLILIITWFVFIALPIGNRGLWAPDEPRYLQVAWEMWRNESYLIPIMNGAIYAEKPPLFFWLTILISKITHFETASRWVSALASLGIILLTFKLGEQSGNRKIGFCAALMMMTSSLFALLMYTGNLDTTLTFFTTLSLYCFVKWESKGRSIYLVLAYAACGFGILIKGPVGLILPWLAFIVWEITKRFRREQTSFWHLLWGPLIALAIAALWVVPACIVGGKEYTQIILLKQQLGRAVQAYVHQRPWYEYLLIFGPNTLPWFVVLAGTIPELKKMLRDKNKYILLYIIWFCSIFIFFSLISSKRERYLLPSYPVFSLICAHAVARWTERGDKSRSIPVVGIMTMVAAIAIMIFPLTLPFIKDNYPQLSIFPLEFGDWRMWATFGLGSAAVVVIWKGLKLVKSRRHLAACNIIALGFLLIAGMAQIYYIPYIEPVKSARLASKTVLKLVPPEGNVAFYRRRLDNGWNFYLNRAKIPIVTDQEIQQRQPRHDLIILKQKHFDLLKAVLDMDNYNIAAIVPVGSKRFVMLKRNPG